MKKKKKKKRFDHISNIMPKLHGVFTEKFTNRSWNAGKTENVPGFKFERF